MNLTWQLTLIIICVALCLTWIIHLEYKRPEKKDQKRFRDPFVMTAIISMAIILVVLLLEGMDALPQGWAKEHWYLFILLVIGIFYWTYQSIMKLKPIKRSKLIAMGWDEIWDHYKAKPHRGPQFGPPVIDFKIGKTNDADDVFNKVANILYRTTVGHILAVMDINNGYIVEFSYRPDKTKVNKLFGRETVRQFDLELDLMKREIMGGDDINYNEPQKTQAYQPA